MDKIKITNDIVENLRQLATNIEKLMQDINAVPAKEESITIEKVRAVLAEKSQSGKQPEVKALITKYGANKLTDIDPAKYADLLKEAEVM